jgi:hypothetical protein
MKVASAQATIERQLWSRFRSPSYWIGAVVPLVLIGVLMHQAGEATDNPPMTMFLAVISALWIGGSGCVREIVDERRLVQRDPHLSLLAYALAKILHAGLMALGQSLVLTLAVVFTGVVHLPFTLLWILLFLTTLSGALMALVLSALCDEAATALAWFPLLLVPQVVFGGFLFPYAKTTPFRPDSDMVTVMPERLIRKPVDSWLIQTAGALSVSRWALEGYAAHAYARDLSDRKAFEEAAQVNVFLPVILSREDVSDRLLAYAQGQSGPPILHTWGPLYLVILVFFAAAQAGALVLIMPLRDPRRTGRT